MIRLLVLLFLFVFSLQIISQEEARLLRFPSVFDNTVVFSYAGDLYTVSLNGGIARKLTSHKGVETFSRFSPDGKYLAFTGQYDGNTEVYLMPSEGGEPKRLTYTPALSRDDLSDRMGPNNIVTSWTPDGGAIVYRSRKKTWNDWKGHLFTVSKEGGMSIELPLPEGGFNSYSPDGKKLAYNKVMREFRTWKYYSGGMADDVWIYNFETKSTENITNNPAQDIFPMWIDNIIYYLSDRDRTMNLFAYNTATKETKKVSDFKEYDIKFPSHDNKGIVFENGGYIYYFNAANQQIKKIDIKIANDVPLGRNSLKDAVENISSVDISICGEMLAFSARGDVFLQPVGSAQTANLTASSGAHDRNAVFSPDGSMLAFISDKTGEFEIYIQKTDKSAPAVQITNGSSNYIYFIKWSPDGKKIAFNNREMKLMYVDVNTKKVNTIVQSKTWEITQFNWSPDSKWICYSDRELNKTMSQIWLHNIETGKSYEITDKWYSSGNPIFSNDGRFLLFTSERDFNPIYSNTEWNHAYNNMTRIYIIPLNKSTYAPFGPFHSKLFDEKNTKTNTVIDIDNIKSRIIDIPVAPGNYRNVIMIDDIIYYYSSTNNDSKTKMRAYDLKEKNENIIGEYGFRFSADGKKVVLISNKKYYVVEKPQSEQKLDKPINIDLKVYVDIAKEWEQIYNEAWRQMRDFFYDPNMHGVDWPSIKTKYSQLLPYARNRHDVNYLIGEMIGELNVGHAYIGGGDIYTIDKIYTGRLGAEISKHSSGYFRIDKILKGQPWNKNLRSPLTDVGVNVKEGDFIIAVDKHNLKDVNDIYKLLWNKAEKEVELIVSAQPTGANPRTIIVVPIKEENNLYYYNWVQNNIKKVEDATNGEVGYIHIPDMGVEGLNEFVKHFYPQLNKSALIIDDRGNGGGNVSPMIIERLRREIAIMAMSRNALEGNTKPAQLMAGPMVLLINNYSASDGDLFPYQFKHHKLGTVIGTRSWGGVVGIRGTLPFVDGTILNKPEFAHYAVDGSGYIIEGYGVDPDIIVENDPAKEYSGIDQQLNKAIEVITEKLNEYKFIKPAIPQFPDKSK